MSSFTLSINFFDFLALLLFSSTCPYRITAGSLLPSILVTHPNHVSLLFLILTSNVTSSPSLFLVDSFGILPLLHLPSIFRSQFITATSILRCLLFSSTSTHQHYHRNDKCSVYFHLGCSCSTSILFIVLNIAKARPIILHFMSLVQRPSSVIKLCRYTNSVTCTSASPSIFIPTVFHCFPLVIVLVFSTLILSLDLWLLLYTSSVSSCSCPLSSATRSMSQVDTCPPTLESASVDFKVCVFQIPVKELEIVWGSK